MAMKDHENIEQKFDRGFQIRPKKIGEFLSSR